MKKSAGDSRLRHFPEEVVSSEAFSAVKRFQARLPVTATATSDNEHTLTIEVTATDPESFYVASERHPGAFYLMMTYPLRWEMKDARGVHWKWTSRW